jgi:hypothetical protein
MSPIEARADLSASAEAHGHLDTCVHKHAVRPLARNTGEPVFYLNDEPSGARELADNA